MNPSARDAYMDASVATASPARLLVMLYERLVLDCQRALDAQRGGDHQEAHRQLLHAQDIVMELRSSLKTDAWEGAPGPRLALRLPAPRLVNANIKRDATITEHCLGLVQDLAQTWREAALQRHRDRRVSDRDRQPSEQPSAAWEVALDRLELDVIMAERLLRTGQPPTPRPRGTTRPLDGPIPADLLARALELQRRQAVVEASLREAMPRPASTGRSPTA